MQNSILKHLYKKKYITDFLIKFMALVNKAQTDDQHTIFLLKNIN